MVGKGFKVPALFSGGYFSMKKGVWRSQISWLFLIHYEISENQKKIGSFLGNLEGVGTKSQGEDREYVLKNQVLLTIH